MRIGAKQGGDVQLKRLLWSASAVDGERDVQVTPIVQVFVPGQRLSERLVFLSQSV